MKDIRKTILLIILIFLDFGLIANNKSKSIDDLLYDKEKYENVIFDYSFDYVAKRNTESKYFYDMNYLFNIPIKVNEKVHVKSTNYKGIANILDFSEYAFEAFKDDKKLIWDIKDFALAGKDWLPNNISNSKWCMKYHFDILKSQEREMLSKYENWINYYADEKFQNYILSKQKSSALRAWPEICVEAGNPEILITDCCVIIRGFFHYYCSYGFVTDKVENKLKVKWIRGNYESCFIDKFETIKDGQESVIEYYLDGDFLTIVLDGTKIELAKKCVDFDTQWKSLIAGNVCDLSKITWPHHADGTSEYEDTIRYPEQVIIEAPEEIEIEDNGSDELKTAEKPDYPNEDDPNYWEILREYYPESYEHEMGYKNYIKQMRLLMAACISVFIIVVIIVTLLIIKKKNKGKK